MDAADFNVRCVPIANAKRFVTSCMVATGCCIDHAQSLADTLVTADYRGHFSHGINRTELYVKELQRGITEKSGEPAIIKQSPATAHIDGKNLLGPVVGNFCIDIAIQKAKKSGIGWVTAKASNHFGIAGYYSMQALKHSLVGYSFTNGSPSILPTRAKQFTLSTNPISCAAPGTNGDSFVLDMATATVAHGKVEVNQRKGIDIPHGWGCDKNAKVTTNPNEVLNGGGLMPLGGMEETSGYKGYGLSMMVDMMCSIMSGADYGPNVGKWGKHDTPRNVGHCFIAVNPAMFVDNFSDRMQDLMDIHRNLEPAEEGKPVLVAGDLERQHMKKCDDLGGIPYPENIVIFMNNLAEKLNVPPLEERKN